MEHWQFLIQKQGDHSWYNLESSNLEILAGKYRILARSHLANANVEVRVSHTSTQEFPPKERVLKRLRRTNSEGLMAVIPFTDFQIGIWELRCAGDLMADILGNSWQHTLKIQVLSAESGEESEYPRTQSISDTSGTPHSTAAVSSQTLLSEDEEDIFINLNHPISPVWFKGETAEQILQSLIDITLPNSPSSQSEDLVEVEPQLPLLNLTLEQHSYIANWGESLTVNGYVETPKTDNLEIEKLSLLSLVVELSSPQKSKQILTQTEQVLTDQVLPWKFRTNINIPHDCESKLILAKISLYGAVNAVGKVLLLGSYTFTITADITELLTITSGKSDPSDFLNDQIVESLQSPSKPEVPVSLGLELFNLTKKPKPPQFYLLKSSPHQSLSPKINPGDFLLDLDHRSAKVLPLLLPQLPKLPSPTNILAATEISESDPDSKIPEITPSIPAIDLDKLEIKPIKASFPYLTRSRAVSKNIKLAIINIPKISPVDTPDISEETKVISEAPTVPTPELISGNIPDIVEISPLLKKWLQKEQFPHETTALMIAGVEAETDPMDVGIPVNLAPEIATSVEAETAAVDVDIPVNLAPEIATSVENIAENVPTITPIIPSFTTISQLPAWLSQEIVMDDLYSELTNEEIEQQEQMQLNLAHSWNKSLPIPQLYLPDGELLAGTSVKVRVELAEVGSSVAVKLWVEDCQTRCLLDGPHLLSNLQPNSWGILETTTQLNVPFGCLEMRLEAIAWDTVTQQESHKITIVKAVVPPDLPTIEPETRGEF